MDYEKVIVELLARIQVLEEQVSGLMAQKEKHIAKEDSKMTTQEIREYIQESKRKAKANGQTSIVFVSGDLHNELGLKKSWPKVCNAMWQCMGPEDVVLHTTKKGQSTTIKIEYKL